MNSVLTWLKSNVLIVIFCVLAIGLPITAWIFSTGWSESIAEEQETRARQLHSQVTGARVTYALPAVMPGESTVEVSSAPNRRLTEWFQQQRDNRLDQVGRVREELLAFNRRGHAPLVDGLFPEPETADDRDFLPIDFMRQLVGFRGAPSAYDQLLESFNAGRPGNDERLVESLSDLRDRERERIRAERGPGDLTEEEERRIAETLMDRRLSEYQRRARLVTVFVDEDALLPGRSNEFSARPGEVPSERPTLHRTFELQWDFWMVSDLLAAITNANSDENGNRMNVEQGVVKRVKSIEVERMPIWGSEPAARRNAIPEGPDGLIGTDPEHSVTGRWTNPGNQLYDVRVAHLTLIVSSERLPELFDAFSRTNLMTVIGLSVEEVDVWEDLRAGFYYGSDHVVQVELQVETIWVRDWMRPLMPPRVRELLGVEDAERA